MGLSSKICGEKDKSFLIHAEVRVFGLTLPVFNWDLMAAITEPLTRAALSIKQSAIHTVYSLGAAKNSADTFLTLKNNG